MSCYKESQKVLKQYCSYRDWNKQVNWNYLVKLMWSEQIILKALKNSKCPSLSLSWGKDSVVMLHLVLRCCRSMNRSINVIFANTRIEYPETYKYRDMMLKTVFKDIDYYETQPIKDFWMCVKEYGYPHQRMTSEQHTSKRTPMCCIYLKERPLRNKQKELGVDLNFMGLQTSESMNRRRLYMRLGAYYYKKSEDINVCLPLAIWNDSDIKRYIEDNNIPINPVYSKMSRTGCMYCTGFKNWKSVMNKYNPKVYEVFVRRKEGQTLLKLIDEGLK